jgi:hypothetical protein
MRLFRVIGTATVLCLAVLVVCGDLPPCRKSVDDLGVIEKLPNHFALKNGSPVRARGNLEHRRRELKSIFDERDHGHYPLRTVRMNIT